MGVGLGLAVAKVAGCGGGRPVVDGSSGKRLIRLADGTVVLVDQAYALGHLASRDQLLGLVEPSLGEAESKLGIRVGVEGQGKSDLFEPGLVTVERLAGKAPGGGRRQAADCQRCNGNTAQRQSQPRSCG